MRSIPRFPLIVGILALMLINAACGGAPQATEPPADALPVVKLQGMEGGTSAAVTIIIQQQGFDKANGFQAELYQVGFAVVDILTVALIAATVHPQVRFSRLLLGREPLLWIGLRSYGIYLWHLTVMERLVEVGRWVGRPSMVPLVATTTALASAGAVVAVAQALSLIAIIVVLERAAKKKK